MMTIDHVRILHGLAVIGFINIVYQLVGINILLSLKITTRSFWRPFMLSEQTDVVSIMKYYSFAPHDNTETICELISSVCVVLSHDIISSCGINKYFTRDIINH